MRDILNLKIKYCKSFRLFIPFLLEQYTGEYFEINVRSPYLLMAVPIKRVKEIFDQMLLKNNMDYIIMGNYLVKN